MRGVALTLALLTGCTTTECIEDSLAVNCGRGDECIVCTDQHLPHSYPACVGQTAQGAGICGLSCWANFGNCNRDDRDGCETPLDSEQNCGACDRLCKGTCTPAGCVETVADGEQQPTGLVADFERVYWASRAGGQVRVRTAIDATAPPLTLATLDAADGLPATLGFQDGALILSTGALAQSDGGSGVLLQVPRDGGTPTIIAMGLDGPARFAVDGATLYWTQSGSGELMRQVASGVSEVIASGRFHPRDIAVDAGTVYWLEEANDGGVASIFSLVPDGGVVQQVSGPSEPASNLVLSSQGLYWVREGRATFLERTWRDFAHVVPFTYGHSAPWHVTSAVDGRNASLFWTDSAAHAIRTAGACDLVAGELNPDWVAIGINPNRTNVLEPGLHVFWVEGARIRRLVTTNIHPWGEWCH